MNQPRPILTEPFIQEKVLQCLISKGWSNITTNAELWEQGVDIKVRHKQYGRYWLIEVKGDPSSKVKNPSGSRSSSFNSAIGQIISRMHNNRKTKYLGCQHGYKYGIAFSTYFRDMVIRKLPHWVMRKLCLYVFFVNQKGHVEEIDWRLMKKLQNEFL